MANGRGIGCGMLVGLAAGGAILYAAQSDRLSELVTRHRKAADVPCTELRIGESNAEELLNCGTAELHVHPSGERAKVVLREKDEWYLFPEFHFMPWHGESTYAFKLEEPKDGKLGAYKGIIGVRTDNGVFSKEYSCELREAKERARIHLDRIPDWVEYHQPPSNPGNFVRNFRNERLGRGTTRPEEAPPPPYTKTEVPSPVQPDCVPVLEAADGVARKLYSAFGAEGEAQGPLLQGALKNLALK